MPIKTPEQTLRDAANAVARGQLTMARRFVDQALDDPNHPPLLRAELLTMRGFIRSEQRDHPGARRDLADAVQVYDDHGAAHSLRLARTLGLLAQEHVEHCDDPLAARPVFERQLAILNTNLAHLPRPSDLLVDKVMSLLGLAMTHEVLESYAVARQLFHDAQATCDQARLPRTHRARGMIAEGLERLPS